MKAHYNWLENNLSEIPSLQDTSTVLFVHIYIKYRYATYTALIEQVSQQKMFAYPKHVFLYLKDIILKFPE